MTNDPIADLLTRIRNGALARKENIVLPHSIIKMGILKVLKDRKFIESYEADTEKDRAVINVTLNPERKDLNLKRVSKPGQRIYVKTTDLKKIHGGLGVSILSTPKGVMSGEEARKMKLGGELICEIY